MKQTPFLLVPLLLLLTNCRSKTGKATSSTNNTGMHADTGMGVDTGLVCISGFWMDSSEISSNEYREFILDSGSGRLIPDTINGR